MKDIFCEKPSCYESYLYPRMCNNMIPMNCPMMRKKTYGGFRNMEPMLCEKMKMARSFTREDMEGMLRIKTVHIDEIKD